MDFCGRWLTEVGWRAKPQWTVRCCQGSVGRIEDRKIVEHWDKLEKPSTLGSGLPRSTSATHANLRSMQHWRQTSACVAGHASPRAIWYRRIGKVKESVRILKSF